MNNSCPICSTGDLDQLDIRDAVPILMNRLYSTALEGRAATRGALVLMGCRGCGFVWNAAFNSSLIVYDASYENDQTHSLAFSRHLRDRARDVVAAVPAGDLIDFLEVGCGQGRFIEEVALVAERRLRSVEGFDPAWRGAEGEGPTGGRIHTCYFDTQTAGRLLHAPNVVATRHTIEHVPDPVVFLSALREALGPDSHATVFIETPCVEWILGNAAMQDFFYEHCSLFTADALTEALRRSGFFDVAVDHVFGGQYLWARASTFGRQTTQEITSLKPRPLPKWARQQFTEKWRADLAERTKFGPVALWGAGAKGVNFSLMVDPHASMIDHVIDINPAKQGKYLPGSGVPVVSPLTAATRKASTIYVMNPNYLDEIRTIATNVGIAAEFVPIN